MSKTGRSYPNFQTEGLKGELAQQNRRQENSVLSSMHLRKPSNGAVPFCETHSPALLPSICGHSLAISQKSSPTSTDTSAMFASFVTGSLRFYSPLKRKRAILY